MSETKKDIIRCACAAALLAVAFCAGRASVRVRVEEKVVFRDRVEWRDRVVEKKTEGPVRVRVVTHEIPGPQGPERVVERVVERGPVTTERRSDERASEEKTAEKLKLRVPEGPSFLVGPSFGARLDNLSPTIGGFLMFKAFDPIWLGVAADSSGSLRVQAALAF